MHDAESVINDDEIFLPAISIDEDIREKILNYYYGIRIGISNHSLTERELLELIVQAELSDRNDIFVYVVNVLKEKMRSFKYPAAGILSHGKMIATYVERRGGMSITLNKIKMLPPVWVEMIADLIKALWNRDGDIDIGRDGEEGMWMIEKNTTNSLSPI